jgi:hypothetical protein
MNFVERMITRKVAEALMARRPFETITVCSERGYDPDAKRFANDDANTTSKMIEGIVEEADQFDECHIFVGGDHETGYGPYVYLIYGNGNGGWDLISDYSVSLEETLKPVLDWIEKEGD